MRRAWIAVFLLTAGCLIVDPATWPTHAQGSSTVDIGPADAVPVVADDMEASFRTNCTISHVDYADPIVSPGRKSAHAHQFFGNTWVDESSTAYDIRYQGNSTCHGGIANRTAYWVPVMTIVPPGADGLGEYPMVPANLPCPPGEVGTQCALDRSNALQVYYKSGLQGLRPIASDYPYSVSLAGWTPTDIQNFPEGLRIVAGDARATEPQDRDVIDWWCATGPAFDQGRTLFSSVMPSCAPGLMVVLTVRFPQCWDGINLDSADHQSHMAYGLGAYWPPGQPAVPLGCPPSHPVPLPEITELYRWRVPPEGMVGWQLSSDPVGAIPGLTAHADWWNGWDPAVFETMLNGCYRKPVAAGRDCQMNLLGDGTQLK